MLVAVVAAPRATGLAARFFRGTLAALGEWVALVALGEWVVLAGIVFYVASSLRRPRRDDLLLSVGLRGDFGGC